MKVLRAVTSILLLIAADRILADARPSLEELFQWGEYDSLIHALEPRRTAADGETALRGLASRTDSAEEAKARLYLGVAYWATGRREEGTRAFAVASRLDPDLTLDHYYATPELAARYEQIADAVRRSAPVARSAAGRPQEGPLPPREPALPAAPKVSRVWIWWTGAAALAAAGAAAGTYVLLRLDEDPKITTTIIDPKPSESP